MSSSFNERKKLVKTNLAMKNKKFPIQEEEEESQKVKKKLSLEGRRREIALATSQKLPREKALREAHAAAAGVWVGSTLGSAIFSSTS
jgi:hypothetical protein